MPGRWLFHQRPSLVKMRRELTNGPDRPTRQKGKHGGKWTPIPGHLIRSQHWWAQKVKLFVLALPRVPTIRLAVPKTLCPCMVPALMEGAGEQEKRKVGTGLMTSRPAGLHRLTGMAVPAQSPIRAGSKSRSARASSTFLMSSRPARTRKPHTGDSSSVELRNPEEALRKRSYPSGRETGPSVKQKENAESLGLVKLFRIFLGPGPVSVTLGDATVQTR